LKTNTQPEIQTESTNFACLSPSWD